MNGNAIATPYFGRLFILKRNLLAGSEIILFELKIITIFSPCPYHFPPVCVSISTLKNN
jgi:hypothetical protein